MTKDSKKNEVPPMTDAQAGAKTLSGDSGAPQPPAEKRQSTASKHISRAPPPGKPVRGIGGGLRSTPYRQRPVEPIDWMFWRLQRYVKAWEAAALSIGMNPDSMRHHRDAWMAGGELTIFELQAFSDATQHKEFDKRYRLADTWGKQHGDRVKYFNSSEIELLPYVAWLASNGMKVPSELGHVVGEHAGTEFEGGHAELHSDTENLQGKETTVHDADRRLADLFDPVGIAALEKMFPTNPGSPIKTKWKKWSERKVANGLNVASDGRSKYNPVLAAKWWLDRQGPVDWDWARCKRRLVDNLPERSKDSRHLLIDEIE